MVGGEEQLAQRAVGTVDGVAGMAIRAIDGVTAVANSGTVTGSIDLAASILAGVPSGTAMLTS